MQEVFNSNQWYCSDLAFLIKYWSKRLGSVTESDIIILQIILIKFLCFRRRNACWWNVNQSTAIEIWYNEKVTMLKSLILIDGKLKVSLLPCYWYWQDIQLMAQHRYNKTLESSAFFVSNIVGHVQLLYIHLVYITLQACRKMSI